ncbi:hypothetical protein TNCV_4136281 [Trichonephila clavipes]|nr:hypothetical protein TNCV_4136281 [Trichonephila clavipes]
MTNIELRNIIIGSKDYEEGHFRGTKGKWARQLGKNRQAARNPAARWESGMNCGYYSVECQADELCRRSFFSIVLETDELLGEV